MLKLNFTQARQLTVEFQKKFAPFVMGQQAGRFKGHHDAFMCVDFGLGVEHGLQIEIGTRSIGVEEMPDDGYLYLPWSEYVGSCGTVPILYIPR